MVKEIWPIEPIYRPVIVDDMDYEKVKGFIIRYNIEYRALNRRFRKLLDVPQGLVLDHIDGDRNNYRRDNLQAITHSHNIRRAYGSA